MREITEDFNNARGASSKEKAVKAWAHLMNLEKELPERLKMMLDDADEKVRVWKRWSDEFLMDARRFLDEDAVAKFKLEQIPISELFTEESEKILMEDLKKNGEITQYILNKIKKGYRDEIYEVAERFGVLDALKNNDVLYKMADGGEATALTTTERIIQEFKKINPQNLNENQKAVYDVVVGNKAQSTIAIKDAEDIYTLYSGSRKGGMKKIITKHGGVEKTGGLSKDEILNLASVIKDGELNHASFELKADRLRYAYTHQKDGVGLRVVVDEYNDGRKVFDFYSDRNFIKYGGTFDLANNRQRVELRNAFYRGADSASKEIYKKVESAIKDSGVRVEFADELGKTLAMGEYHADKNLIKIKKGMKEGETSNTILHEMIHAATAHAIKNPANLTPKQLHALSRLEKIYTEAKAANTDARLDYAFKNLDEFVAELSNPALSQSLKSGGFFERIIDAIAQFFGIAGISKNSQARKALYDLLDTTPKSGEGVMYKIYKERTESAGVKDDRIAAKSQGAKVAQELKEALKKDLLGVDGKIDISKFEAQPLPKADFKSREQFKAKFKNVDGRMGTAETALGDMLVDTHYAYRHFYINTNNKNRNYLKGAFFDILQNPLAISKYGNSVYFFKIYNYKGSNKGIFSIGINLYDGSLKYKTTYDDIEKNRMAEMLKKHEVISYKGKGNSR